MDQKKAFWELFFEILNSGQENLIEKALKTVATLEDQKTMIAQIAHAAIEFSEKPEKVKVTREIIKILEEKAIQGITQNETNNPKLNL